MRHRKLQIFLSSTYTDLMDLRLAAIEAILAAGHIPATMEQFTPGDETALEVIQRWIKDSDAFILLLGGRFGSIEPKSGKSYVQIEYELALQFGKPLFGMIMSEEALQCRVEELGLDVADEREHQSQYRDFKQIVQQKLCSWFSDGKDIRAIIFQKLPEWDQRDDLAGWVRGNDAISPQVTEELARLSQENASLRESLARSSSQTYEGLSFERLVELLKGEPVSGELFSYLSTIEAPQDPQTARFCATFGILHIGHFLELNMEGLSRGLLRGLKTGGNSAVDSVYQAMNKLVFYGLVNRDTSSEKGFVIYKLTDTGRKFKNQLLAMGSQEFRMFGLWSNIPIIGNQ